MSGDQCTWGRWLLSVFFGEEGTRCARENGAPGGAFFVLPTDYTDFH